MEIWADRVRSKLEEFSRSFFIVILLVAAVYLIAESYAGDEWAQIPISLLVYTAVLIAIRGMSGSQRMFNLHVAVIVPAFLLTLLGVLVETGALLVPGQVVTTALSITVPAMVLKFVLTSGRINSNVIFAAISVYLMLGIVFGTIFTWLAYGDPAAFAPPQEVDSGDSSLFYYSFVTLTTLGFGDIAPVSETARALTVIEALAGQIYLVVLVARLVAMHIARRQAENAALEAERLREEIRHLDRTSTG
jgi:hypothetical protein